MAVRVPLLLRRLRPALAHFVHSLPLVLPCPAVLTVQDLSFERDRSLMGSRETAIFRIVVPRSVHRARRVLAISQRTKDDLVELYHTAPEKVVVTPLACDPAFRPGGTRGDYLLLVGSVEERKNPLLAAEAAPRGRPAARRRRTGARRVARRRAPPPRRRRARVRRAGRARPSLPGGGGAALPDAVRGLRPSRRGGDGLRHARRRDTDDPAVREVGARRDRLRRRATPSPRRSCACSPIRSRGRAQGSSARSVFSWDRTAALTVEVYRQALA